MKDVFKHGDKKEFTRWVGPEDIASFEEGDVHQVYATFALGRDAEWCCRLFVLDMKSADEEGIGTFLNVFHHAPALMNEEVQFEAIYQSLEKNELICAYIARVGDRVIATGNTGQKIIKKERLDQLFSDLKNQ